MRYELIHLNGFMYAVDKEAYPVKGDTVFVHGLCKLEDDLWRRGNFIQIVEWSNYPSYLDVKISKESTWRPIRQVTKIVATNDPSLNLPLLPAVEKNLDELQELVYELPVDWVGTGDTKSAWEAETEWNTRWVKTYKAASAKQFTEEDMQEVAYKVTHFAATMKTEVLTFQKAREITERYIQSLKPKPVAVELEMTRKCELNKSDCLGFQEMPPDCGCQWIPLVDENNFVKVKQWYYE